MTTVKQITIIIARTMESIISFGKVTHTSLLLNLLLYDVQASMAQIACECENNCIHVDLIGKIFFNQATLKAVFYLKHKMRRKYVEVGHWNMKYCSYLIYYVS